MSANCEHHFAQRCEHPSERHDGTLCGSDYGLTIVDVLHYEDDGSATFFTLPLCRGHRLALGWYVVHYEPAEEVTP